MILGQVRVPPSVEALDLLLHTGFRHPNLIDGSDLPQACFNQKLDYQ